MATISDYFEDMIFKIDGMLDTKRKRHVMGGVLISFSLLFCGLAITVFTIKNEEDDRYE